MANNNAADNLLYKKLQAVIDEKKDLRDPLIEILRSAQEIFGYLPVEVQEYISEAMNIPVAQIYGVVTFYNFFSMEPRGKHVINVCTGTACFVKGAPGLIRMFEEELGIKLGETTADGLFTLSSVRCVGACSLAPVFVIGEETFGRVDSRKKLKKVLEKYRN
ncbi:MAG TPA: NAD(P)H-dependent oxidoreductase subunit E [Candidatus Cloacimonadota bacterium]|nr:NAD(P)H-dependent oxidoreductase subunit E [Candidatus Cloacimonadota bacterium]